MPAEDYFFGPGIDITRMTILQPGDLLTAIRLPATWGGARFYFEKVRDRQVWDFALVSVASAMVVNEGGNGHRAHAHRRQRRCGAAAAPPVGRGAGARTARQRGDRRGSREPAIEGARPLRFNGYKVPLMRNLVKRAIRGRGHRMDFLTWGRDPWDQPILTHISWDLLWASLFAGVAFLVAHASYMVFSAHRKRHADETDAMEAAHADLPRRIVRHSLAARMFHWVMAAAMFTLLLTAFLPIAGVRFAWVTWHWSAGLVLTASILFHIIHATVWLDFWSIWVGPRDLPELKAEVLREFGHDVPGPRPASTPLGNRLYHLAIVVAALTVVASGLFMMVRVQTPFLTRNPYHLRGQHVGPRTCLARHWRRDARRTRHRARLLRRAGPRSGGLRSR